MTLEAKLMPTEYINIKDKNSNDIFVGAVIKHNDNLYVIKYSKNQKVNLARKQPLSGCKSSWRNLEWIKRCSNYIQIIGTVYHDDELYDKFKEVLPNIY